MNVLPISAIVPTMGRGEVIARTFNSLLGQHVLPAELVVVDASHDGATRLIVSELATRLAGICKVIWLPAAVVGAAAQRNQGMAATTQANIWFFDDDIIFESECVLRLWAALETDLDVGGASAMITNQCYHRPGWFSGLMYRVMAGERASSYAGRVLGPAVNLLPADCDSMSAVVQVEWLNTTCTLYRRVALPNPPFSSHFTGYSMFEDVTLSLTVAKRWRLVNARTARIFHDSQPGLHKSDLGILAEMALLNRHHVMTQVMGRNRPRDYLNLILWTVFGQVALLRSANGRGALPRKIRGEWRAIQQIVAALR